MNIHDIYQVAIVIDRAVMMQNLTAMQTVANKHSIQLRPHIKSHKSIDLARLQCQAGAVGITVATFKEAMIFIEAGIPSVLLAYPYLSDVELNALFQLAKTHQCDLHLMIDHPDFLERIIQISKMTETSCQIRIKIDVGLHRCGFSPEDPMIFHAIQRIQESQLHFYGFMSHAGQSYSANEISTIKQIAFDEFNILNRLRLKTLEQGIPDVKLSVGSTPTVLACDNFSGIDEIRPGNYLLRDLFTVELGLSRLSDIAIHVYARIVSKNQSYLISNAGSKILSSDKGAHGNSALQNYGMIFHAKTNQYISSCERLSEEHGFIPHGNQTLHRGDAIKIAVNHSCPVMNLADNFYLLENGQLSQYSISARGHDFVR